MDETSPAPAGRPTTDGAVRTLTADVVVVGARCAGAATAMLLARAGHDVLVVDRASFPSDTVSTHVIARSGVVQLNRWGLLGAVHASGAPPVRLVEIDTGAEVITRAIKDKHGVDHLLAPRRVVLDGLLQNAARSAGARLLTGFSVDDVLWSQHGRRVVGVRGRDAKGSVRVLARHVVGADGLGSRVARAVGSPFTDVRPTSGAVQYAYVAGPWPAIEYHVVEGALAGIFPTHGGESCVWICTPEEVARHHQRTAPRDCVLTNLLRELAPHLFEKVREGEQVSPVRGMLRMPNHVRRPWGPGWSLVGDAGYHRDAITGFGISDAFRDAELLAEALGAALRDQSLEDGAMAGFAATRDRMSRPVLDLTLELAAFPGPERFVELQRELAVAIDDQASELAARPSPVGAATG